MSIPHNQLWAEDSYQINEYSIHYEFTLYTCIICMCIIKQPSPVTSFKTLIKASYRSDFHSDRFRTRSKFNFRPHERALVTAKLSFH